MPPSRPTAAAARWWRSLWRSSSSSAAATTASSSRGFYNDLRNGNLLTINLSAVHVLDRLLAIGNAVILNMSESAIQVLMNTVHGHVNVDHLSEGAKNFIQMVFVYISSQAANVQA